VRRLLPSSRLLVATSLIFVLNGWGAQPALGSAGPIITELGNRSDGNNWMLSATIDPGSTVTEYEFWLRIPECAECASYSQEVVGSGVVPAEAGPTRTSAELIEPEYGFPYSYWVVARNASGVAESEVGYFTPPLPPPDNEPTPYEPTLPPWLVEQEARSAEERTRQEKEQHAREEESAEPQVQHCIVPQLRGDTVTTARRALRHAHCRLGMVSHAPSARRERESPGNEVVVRQSQPEGRRLPTHWKIGVRLAPSSTGN
jgi:hypothetical protein